MEKIKDIDELIDLHVLILELYKKHDFNNYIKIEKEGVNFMCTINFLKEEYKYLKKIQILNIKDINNFYTYLRKLYILSNYCSEIDHISSFIMEINNNILRNRIFELTNYYIHDNELDFIINYSRNVDMLLKNICNFTNIKEQNHLVIVLNNSLNLNITKFSDISNYAIDKNKLNDYLHNKVKSHIQTHLHKFLEYK